MATIMTKQGNLDNVVTYEHICDTFEDVQFIDPHYITLGSTCVVINGESGGLEVYMADSNKEWQSISVVGGEGSSSLPIQILGPDDYDEDGVPTIDFPTEDTIYLVPSDTEYTNDIFKEWVYINDSWEQVGGVHISVPTPDWNETDATSSAYILNKPSIKASNSTSIIEGDLTRNIASGTYSHAEGKGSKAIGNYSHAEGCGQASGMYSHAEGNNTQALSDGDHAEGFGSIANHYYYNGVIGPAHAEGIYTKSYNSGTHSEGYYTEAHGRFSHTEGDNTVAKGYAQHIFGAYNILDTTENNNPDLKGTYIEIVGNGTDTNNRSNARTLDWSGNERLAGSLTLGSTTLTEAALQNLLSLTAATGVSF